MEDQDKIKAQVEAANQLLDEKNFSEAVKTYQRIVVSGTETAEVNLGLAKLQYRLRKYDAAVKTYQAIFDSGTRTTEVRLGLAESLYGLGKYDEAAKAYRAILGLGTSTAEVWRGLGNSLYGLWVYEGAIEAFNRAIECVPYPAIYDDLGETLYQLRRFREAIENYEKAGAPFLAKAEKATSEAVDADKCPSDEKKEEAKQKRADAQEAFGIYADSCIDIGYCYLCLRDYDKAIESLNLAISKAGQYPLAYHALASVFWTQGNYQAAMTQWTIAKDHYKNCEDQMLEEDNEWTGWLMYEGTLLHEVFGNLPEAKRVYDLALAINKDLIRAWAGLTALNVERQENYPKERNRAATDKQEAYKNANEIIKSKDCHDVESLLMIGELALSMADYDLAKTSLINALRKDEEQKEDPRYMRSAKPNADLGVLYMRMNQFNRTNQYGEAIRYFQAAMTIDPTDLSLRSNLAEAYLRDNRLDDAEQEFCRVLKTAPDHIESRIGLGAVYSALGEAGDPDMYDAAVTQYSRALTLSATSSGSKRLTKSELAKVRYSRGYAYVKSYEAFKAPSERRRLRDARTDFAECLTLDEDQHKAKRAIEKIDKVLPRRSPQKYMEDWGPSLILALSLVVFLVVEWKFLKNPQFLPPGGYIAVTFGLLLFMVASCYLPQLLKLKVPGIELEKTAAVDQITTLGPVGISKPT
jgi:tetratricopeptide (TPR) repeat protein